jgi:RND family efflux transporter MFP subunit
MKRNDASEEPYFRMRRHPQANFGSQFFTRSELQRAGFPLVLFACMLVAGSIVGCSGKPEVVSVSDKAVEVAELTAETIKVQAQSWPTIVRCQGTLYADEDSAIGARVAGRVAKVHVDLGDSVKVGDPLVSLETEEFELLVSQVEAQLNQARSAVGLTGDEANDSLDPENSPPVQQERAIWDEAKASLERATNLKKQGAISQGEFDILASAQRVAEARYAAAVNAVREKIAMIAVKRVERSLARQRLTDAIIRAPFDGRVLNRRIAPGGYISAGDAVASLVRTNPIWFRGTLPERYASRLRNGLTIEIRITSSDEPLIAQVTRISPSLDMASRSLSFEVKIDNEEQQIRAGLFASAEVVLDPEAKSLVVPESAVTAFAGSEKVWKIVDGVAQQLEISSGVRRDGHVEIVEGLAAGDEILMDASIGRVARVTPPKTEKEIVDGRPTIGLTSEVAGEEADTLANVRLP